MNKEGNDFSELLTNVHETPSPPLCPTCVTPIDKHPASQCLDAWVAKDVMGWPVISHGDLEAESSVGYRTYVLVHLCEDYLALRRPLNNEVKGWVYDDWTPSCDIAAAMEMLDHFTKKDIWIGVRFNSSEFFMSPDHAWEVKIGGRFEGFGKIDELPLAISRAAIKAAQKPS